MKIAAAYIRVSSRTQTFAMQRSAIERAAKTRRDRVSLWFAEKYSGKTTARAELARLRSAARAGHFSRLYVYRIDRLTRSGIRDTFEVVEELRAAGVEIITIADNFSLGGPADEIILAMMAWAAKMERLAINERIAAARTRLEAEGRPWGRPSRLAPAKAARIQRLRAKGKSVRAIAVALKVPRATVHRAIQRAANGALR